MTHVCRTSLILLRSQVLRHDPEAVDANFAAAFVSVSGRVCRRLLVASVKVSCQDKKGSRYGPHALEQAMSVMCGGCGPEFVADLEASHPTDASKVLSLLALLVQEYKY